MLTPTLLVLLGIVLVMVLYRMVRSPASRQVTAPPPAPAIPGGTGTELWNARKGDVISIHGAAEDFSDLDFTVDRRSAYQGANRRWIDLSGEYRGRRVYLEVQRGAEVEVTGILDARKLTLADIGASEQQLADFDARQDPSASIEFEGARWQYESSREIGYFEEERGDGEGLYRWIFREQNGPRLLCVEKWEGEPFDVRLARRLNPEDITVYRAA